MKANVDAMCQSDVQFNSKLFQIRSITAYFAWRINCYFMLDFKRKIRYFIIIVNYYRVFIPITSRDLVKNSNMKYLNENGKN